jgi:ferredoxin
LALGLLSLRHLADLRNDEMTMKIILERQNCIGCGSCVAVCPQYFEMAEDNKSHLKDSAKNADEAESLEIEEPGCVDDAADVCPVRIIKAQ